MSFRRSIRHQIIPRHNVHAGLGEGPKKGIVSGFSAQWTPILASGTTPSLVRLGVLLGDGILRFVRRFYRGMWRVAKHPDPSLQTVVAPPS